MRCLEEEYLLYLCRLREDALAPTASFDWDLFWQRVVKNAVEVQVCSRLDPNLVPHEIYTSVLNTLRWSQKRVERFSQVLDRLCDAGIDVCLLKGAALGPSIYNDLHYKRMNDVDVLFHRTDGDRLFDILRDLGFRTIDAGAPKAGSHHSLPWFCPTTRTVLGIHWNLVSQKKHPISEDALWQNMQPCFYNDRSTYVLCPEMALLHQCIHLPFLKTGLRELADVCHLVQRSTVNWERFYALAADWRAEAKVYRVLSLAHSLSPLREGALFPDAMERRVGRRVQCETSSRIAILLNSRTTQVTEIERFFMLYTLTKNGAEKRWAFAQIWRSVLESRGRLLRIMSLEHGAKRVYGALLGMGLQCMFQALLPASVGAPSLRNQPDFRLFWDLE